MAHLRKSNYRRFFFIAFLIIFMDFILKKWMLLLLFEQPKQIIVTTFFNLTPVWNNGISFGLMSSQPEVVRFIIPILALLVITYLISQLKFQGYLQQLASAIISGGAVGNVIDRILYGKVVDFLDIMIGDFHWYIFNVADSAVTTGMILFILHTILIGEKKPITSD